MVDGTDEIIYTSPSPANTNRTGMVFTRETHTGDSLLIADLDFQAGGAYAGNYYSGLNLQNHSSQSSPAKTILLFPVGTDTNTSNQIILAETETAVGDAARPTEGIAAAAGSRTFLRFNSGELATGTADDKFVEVINQDQDSRFTIRAPYGEMGLRTLLGLHSIVIFNSIGTFKLKRFQLLKYT